MISKIRLTFLFVLLAAVLLAACQQPPAGSAPPPAQTPTTGPIVTLPPLVTEAPTEIAATPAGEPATPAETPPAQTATPTEQEAVAALDQLPFDEFLHESARQLLRRRPEGVVELGLEEVVGLETVTLDNLSADYVAQTQQLERDILDQLRAYDRTALTPAQQVEYDVYASFLGDQVRGHEFALYPYMATHFSPSSVQGQTQLFFTDLHPLNDVQDAQNFVTRLWLVEDKFDQLIDHLDRQEAAGIVPPRFTVQWARGDLTRLVGSSATTSPFYTAFRDRLAETAGLDADQRAALLAEAEAAVAEAVLPAYERLGDRLAELEAVAPTDDGVWQFPGGSEYYAYELRRRTTTDLTADEIHELGLQELERIRTEMAAIFAELGYPAGESLTQSFNRVAQESGFVSGGQIVSTYETILDEAAAQLPTAFNVLPQAELIVIGGETGGFYIGASLDGSRPGAFYAQATGSQPIYNMPSLAYHEGVPGHHLQIALEQEQNLPLFHAFTFFTAYVEGWALYAERLAADLEWYAEDPYGDLGRLQYEAFRAARLVVDTGIHDQGWTYDAAVEFFIENTGYPRGMAEWEIARYVVWPGQSTAYMIGMLRLLELRQLAQEQLGDDFDLAEFHEVVLGHGSMPLDVLENLVRDYAGQ
jgi:uncharacterized protein (DUF885 family)